MSKGGNLKERKYTPELDAKILQANEWGGLKKLSEELNAIPGNPQRSADALYQRKRVLLGTKGIKKAAVEKKEVATKPAAEPHPVNGRVPTGGMQQIKFPGGTITLQGTPRILEIIEDSQGRVEGIRWAM